MDDRMLAFIGVAVAVVIIPGPDMALVARNALSHGRAAGFATALGVCTGILGWALAAAIGVAALLASSAAVFTVLKFAGAAYLIYLGISTLRAKDVPFRADGSPRAGQSWRAGWSQGFLSALLNPKLGVFFLTLLPPFIGPDDPPAARALQLALAFEAIGVVWLLAYTVLLGSLASALHRPRPQRVVRWLTGTVLVGLGLRVASERA